MTDDRPACGLKSPDEICFCLKARMWSCLYGVELSVQLSSVPLELHMLYAILMGDIIGIKVWHVTHLCEFGKQSRAEKRREVCKTNKGYPANSSHDVYQEG